MCLLGSSPSRAPRQAAVPFVTTLGSTPRFHYALIPQAAELLATETAVRVRQVILVIGEAHLLDPDQLEAVLFC